MINDDTCLLGASGCQVSMSPSFSPSLARSPSGYGSFWTVVTSLNIFQGGALLVFNQQTVGIKTWLI